MKYILTISFLLSLTFNSYAQNNQAIQEAKTIYFYGYDFTHFKLAEAKRMNDPITEFIFGWIGYVAEKFTKINFETNMNNNGCLVNEIIYDFNESTRRNKKLNDNLVTVFVPEIPSEAVYRKIISDYKLKQSKGIGLIVFMEYADKSAEMSRIRAMFFDIRTRKILNSTSIISEASGTSMIRHWGKSFLRSMITFSKGSYLRGNKNNSNVMPCGTKPKEPAKFNDPQWKSTKRYRDYKRALTKWRKCTQGKM